MRNETQIKNRIANTKMRYETTKQQMRTMVENHQRIPDKYYDFLEIDTREIMILEWVLEDAKKTNWSDVNIDGVD